jgi:hypothetical protein
VAEFAKIQSRHAGYLKSGEFSYGFETASTTSGASAPIDLPPLRALRASVVKPLPIQIPLRLRAFA